MERERTAITTGKTRKARFAAPVAASTSPVPNGQGKKDGWKGKSNWSKDGRDSGKVGYGWLIGSSESPRSHWDDFLDTVQVKIRGEATELMVDGKQKLKT